MKLLFSLCTCQQFVKLQRLAELSPVPLEPNCLSQSALFVQTAAVWLGLCPANPSSSSDFLSRSIVG